MGEYERGKGSCKNDSGTGGIKKKWDDTYGIHVLNFQNLKMLKHDYMNSEKSWKGWLKHFAVVKSIEELISVNVG